MNSNHRSNQQVEKVVLKYEMDNVQCDIRFEGEKLVKTFLLIFAGILRLTNCQNGFFLSV